MDGSIVHFPSARTPKNQGGLFVVDSGESGGVSGSGSWRKKSGVGRLLSPSEVPNKTSPKVLLGSYISRVKLGKRDIQRLGVAGSEVLKGVSERSARWPHRRRQRKFVGSNDWFLVTPPNCID